MLLLEDSFVCSTMRLSNSFDSSREQVEFDSKSSVFSKILSFEILLFDLLILLSSSTMSMVFDVIAGIFDFAFDKVCVKMGVGNSSKVSSMLSVLGFSLGVEWLILSGVPAIAVRSNSISSSLS